MIVVFDIDGVIRDVGGSYRRALADTVEQFAGYRPSPRDIDALKAEGRWNNDWEAAQELIDRHFKGQTKPDLTYETIVAFFQTRYRGDNPESTNHQDWNGYICQEPLLVEGAYFEALTAAQMPWGFFSGATNGSARFVLEGRLGLESPVLVAMDDAPGKPDPTGLYDAIAQLEVLFPGSVQTPVVYVGDTVADMQTVVRARGERPDRTWVAVGVLPPHVLADAEVIGAYKQGLIDAGAAIVVDRTLELTPDRLRQTLATEFLP
jgi:HAD superfamily phosphatase